MTDTNNGHFVWHEFLARDTKAAIAFYKDVIGWKTEPFGDQYTMWVGSQGPLGGVMTIPDEAAKMGVPPNWTGYIQVQDVDATAGLAKKLGGKVLKEPDDIPTVGRFAVIADPQGAVIAIFKPLSAMTLHDTTKPEEFCWNELIPSDNMAAFKFYSEIFGWKVMQDMDMGPMGTYRIYGIGDKQFGGMMTAPKGSPMPPMWMFYIETANLDAATGRATKSGAKVINGPMEVPGGHIVQMIDPQGAAFSMHQLAKK